MNLGLVRRLDGNGERISVLWYCKPALTQDMPPQLLAYREVDPTFPRVSTINQFFHVAQFTAYRDLGRFNARKVLSARATLAAEVARHESFSGFRLDRGGAPGGSVRRARGGGGDRSPASSHARSPPSPGCCRSWSR